MDSKVLNQQIAFCLHIYDEPKEQIKECLKRLRKCYPDNDVFIICEGNLNYKKIALQFADLFNCWFFNADRLKLLEYGGLWSHRYLDLFLYRFYSNVLLCRIDPDTMFHRQFNFKQDDRENWQDCAIFGSIYHNSSFNHKFVLGGCILFWRYAVQRIVDSEILKLGKFCKMPFGYQPYTGFMKHDHQNESNEYLSSQDRILGQVCHELNLHIRDWREVRAVCRGEITPEDVKTYAVTHPHIVGGLNGHIFNI